VTQKRRKEKGKKRKKERKKDERRQKIQCKRTVLLHDSKELDDDLGGRTDENLALASLLGVVHGVERIVEDGSLDHCGGVGIEILKSKKLKKDYEVSVR
jgi:hypothetical protein